MAMASGNKGKENMDGAEPTPGPCYFYLEHFIRKDGAEKPYLRFKFRVVLGEEADCVWWQSFWTTEKAIWKLEQLLACIGSMAAFDTDRDADVTANMIGPRWMGKCIIGVENYKGKDQAVADKFLILNDEERAAVRAQYEASGGKPASDASGGAAARDFQEPPRSRVGDEDIPF